ncbi:MAG: methyl-accepting chemotaxis protein [Methylococcales bacterium]|nr:methyl-accepting chemotaxis protein [Methylococcales bacterium]
MFKKFTIKTRLILIIIFSAILTITLGALGLVGMQKTNAGLRTVYEDRTIPLAQLADIQMLQLNSIRSLTINSLAGLSDATLIEKNRTEIIRLWDAYMATYLTPEEEQLAKQFAADQKRYLTEGLNPAIVLLRTGNKDEFLKHIENILTPTFAPVEKGIESLIQLQQDVAQQEYEASQSRYQTLLFVAIAACVFGMASLAFIAVTLIRGISGSLQSAQQIAAAIAAGDLSSTIDTQQHDEIGDLLRSMKAMQDGLSGLVNEIETIVDAAVQGDFGLKMNLSGKQGFGKNISTSLNQLSETTEVGLNDVMRVTRALADGDLSQKITRDYPGVFGLTKDGVNNTVDSLTKIVGEIQRIVDAAANHGDFSVKMELFDKQGYTKTLAELLNQLSMVTETGLNDVLRVVASLAQGDLTQVITRDYPGTFGQVKDAVNGTVANLKTMISDIQEASETISTAAKEIASGNNDLSHRTEEQASSLEETAASMQELTSTVHHNTENAKHANELAINATNVAGKGVEVVDQVIDTMESINNSSRKVVDIIAVIDGIAFQTNILALNAAVEAARAGEQGRGFAVVAGEVRNLAQRAAAAAGEIKNLIGNSVEQIEDGTRLVTHAGKTMEDIVNSIHGVTVIMSEIASASVQQTSGIEQVNLAIGQMDDVTQQNAALVEQAAAAAESLEEQTQNLTATVGQFKVDNRSVDRSAFKQASAAVKLKKTVGQPQTAVASNDWEAF